MKPEPGHLYVVATPLGNLQDITLRALDTLRSVSIIACEDTRHSRKLLTHYGIEKKVVSYFEYSKRSRADRLISHLEQGRDIAYIVDAGTPGIADPGCRLIALAHAAAIPVVPIPGPSSLTTILSIAGFPTHPAHFWGFLSPKRSKRLRLYELIRGLEGSHVFFESPHKLLKRISEFKQNFIDYQIFIGKEMTKHFESYIQAPLETIDEELATIPILGEFTLVLSREKLTDGISIQGKTKG